MDLLEKIKILKNHLNAKNFKKVIEGANKLLKKIVNSYLWTLLKIQRFRKKNQIKVKILQKASTLQRGTSRFYQSGIWLHENSNENWSPPGGWGYRVLCTRTKTSFCDFVNFTKVTYITNNIEIKGSTVLGCRTLSFG